MATMTKTLYPNISSYSLSQTIIANLNDNYEIQGDPITCTFNIDGIANVTSAVIKYNVASVSRTLLNGRTESELNHGYITGKLNTGNILYKSLVTQEITYTLTTEQINNILNKGVTPVFTIASENELSETATPYEDAICRIDATIDSCYMEVTYEIPDVSNLTVTGTNIDEEITLSWTMDETVTSWKLEAYIDGTLYSRQLGTTATTYTYAAGALKYKGNWTFKLIVSNGAENEITKDVTLARTEPSILSIEPDGVNQDVGTVINITWVTLNQSSYTLKIDDITFTGTTATSLTIPANTLTKGTKTISLTVSYTSSWGETRKTSSSVTFLAYGKPDTPTLDGTTYYSSDTPTFTWSSDEQVAYRFIIESESGNTLLDTQEVTSQVCEYTSTLSLENNTNYIVKVAVKNQFSKWSDFASKTITTNFTIANVPTINVISSNNGVLVNINCVWSSDFYSCEVWRRTEYTEWVRIAYNLDNTYSFTDKFVGSDKYYYKARSISTSGGKADSETVSASSSVSNFNFMDVENNDKSIELVGNPNIKITTNRDVSATIYAGSYAPVLEIGETNYKQGTASFTVRKQTYDKFISVINGSTVLLYRDRRGEKIFCQITSDITKTYQRGDVYSISFAFTEVPVIEEDMIVGNGDVKVVKFNGKYKFNGAIKFNGEVTN